MLEIRLLELQSLHLDAYEKSRISYITEKLRLTQKYLTFCRCTQECHVFSQYESKLKINLTFNEL